MRQSLLLNTGAGALALVLAGCDAAGDSGRLRLSIADAPVDRASKVVVQFTGVEVKPADGEAIDFDFDLPRSVDLLALSGGASEVLLDDVELPDGRYNWVRLKVNAQEDGAFDSYIELEDATQRELEVPSGAQSGLKLIAGFIVPAGGTADFTVDFDLRKSLHEPMDAGDSYKLRPTLRLVDNAEAGSIAGTVDAALVPDGCTPAVYVFEGAGVAPDDVDGNAPEPVTGAAVAPGGIGGQYEYRAAFLAAGVYTVALTCQAAADDPQQDDAAVTFAGTQDATVTAQEEATVDFVAAPPP